MKRKYQGIVSVALIALAVTAGVSYAVRLSHKSADKVRISSIRPFPSVSVPDPATIGTIETMKEIMVELVQLTTSRVQPVNLGFLGYEPTVVPEEVIEEKDGDIITGSLFCAKCNHSYPIKEGIPNLLPPDA